MDTMGLKEYLGIVVDMEKNIFMQDRIIQKMESEIAGLGKEKEFAEPPQPKEQPLPKKHLRPSPPPLPDRKAIKIAIRNFVIAVVIILMVGEASSLKLVSSGMSPVPIGNTIMTSVFIGAITGIITYCIYRQADIEEKDIYKRSLTSYEQKCAAYEQKFREECSRIDYINQVTMATYQKELEQYRDNVAEDQRRVRLENIKKDVLLVELSKLKEQNKSSKETLKQIYDKNIIFPKYRNLVMTCSLYEYICSGRCDKLEGHEGAYNILEMEIRLDKIIIQIDRVICMLERIREGQYMVYTAIQSANQQSEKILESTYRIVDRLQEADDHLQKLQVSGQQMAGNIQAGIQSMENHSMTISQQLLELQNSSALTAYQAERTRNELHYLNRMKYLSVEYDDVFFNLPPR